MQLTPVTSSATHGLNISLFKVGPILHVTIGAVIASMVLVASTLTIVLVSARANYTAPNLLNDTATTFKTSSIDIYVLKNDVDLKGATLTITKVTQPMRGAVTIKGSGSFVTYTPDNIGVVTPHFSGKAIFSYTATNGKVEATANVTVNVMNHVPEPVDLTYTISKNTKSNPLLVFSDVGITGLTTLDLDQDTMTVSGIGLVNSTTGSAIISADQLSVLYTPALNFKSSLSFSYTVFDGNDTKSAKITITVQNDAPKARPDFYTINKNVIATGLNVLLNDNDPNGDDITVVSVRSTGKGAAYITNLGKTCDYWQLKGVYQDSFEYTISDGELTSSSYVAITILNQAPVAGTFTVSVPKNSAGFTIPLVYSDPDPFETLTITLKTQPSLGSQNLTSFSTLVTSDYLSFDSSIIWANNTWTLNYIPNSNTLGQDVFTYTVSDGIASTDGIITVNIINTAPIAVDDYTSCVKNSINSANIATVNVLSNDYDPNGDAIKLVSADATSTNGGVVTVNANMLTINYKPAAGYQGVDKFAYTITDIQSIPSLQLTAQAMVYIQVNNTAPVAVNDVYTYNSGNTVSLDILINDSDINGDSISIGAFDTTSTSGVTLTKVNIGGVDKISYVALSGPQYTDTFTYQTSDGFLLSNIATVTINIINGAPTAVPDVVNVRWNGSVIINVVANDIDPNPTYIPNLQVKVIDTLPTNGLAVLDSQSKSITYTPRLGFVGVDTLTYKVMNPYGAFSSIGAVVTINVINTAPNAVTDNYNQHCTLTSDYNVLINDNDPDSDPFVLVSQTSPQATIVNGNIRFAGQGGMGLKTFSYTISDWNKVSTTTVQVTLTNSPPVAVADSISYHANTMFNIPVLSNDVDADNDPLTIISVDNSGTQGVATIAGNVINFVPTNGYLGVTTFKYTNSDSCQSSQGQVTVTTTNLNPPLAPNKAYTIQWRTLNSVVNLLTSKTDPDGDSLTLSFSGVPAGHSVQQITDPVSGIDYLKYNQSALYLGTSTFQYQVSDGIQSATGNVNFNVVNNNPVAKTYSGLFIPYSQSTLTINAISDATDADSVDVPYLKIVSFVQGTKGIASFDATNKIITYTKTSGTGADSFTYTITDGISQTTATVSLSNGAQVVGSASKTYTLHWTLTRTPYELQLVKNPSIIANTYYVWLTTNTTLAPSPGLITYSNPVVLDQATPHIYYVNYTNNVLGTDSFSVESTDGLTKNQIFVTVILTNAAPTTNDIYTTRHWAALTSPIDVLAVSADADSDPITASISATTCGTAVWNGVSKKVDFTPSTTLGVCSFTYTVTDGIQSSTSTVYVTVTNTPPTVAPKFYTIQWKQHVAGFVINLLTGATDANGDTISLGSIGPISNGIAGNIVAVGASSVNCSAFTPTRFFNSNFTFTYVITDTVQTTSGTVNIRVTDIAPVANNDNYNIIGVNPQLSSPFNIMFNDTEADPADSITIKSISYSGAGTLTTNTLLVTYTPPSQFIGTETATYTITNGIQDSTATVTFTVSNTAPIANPDYATVKWNKQTLIYPLLNDTDVNLPLTYVITGSPSGSIVTQANGSLLYTPSLSQSYTLVNGKMQNNDIFNYRVTDNYGLSSSSFIYVTVFNTAPVASPDAYNINKTLANPTVTFPVLVNDVDADGDSLLISSINYIGANGATITFTPSTILYKPKNTFKGVDTFTYTITDGQLTSTTTVTVTMLNQAPTCTSSIPAGTLNKIQSYNFDLSILGSPSDPNGDTITYMLTSNSFVKAAVSLSGSVATVQSLPNRSKALVLTYVVNDGQLNSTQCSVTLNIVNQAPIALPDTYAYFRTQSPVTLTTTQNDTDPDAGDSLTITSISDPDNLMNNPNIGGSVAISGDNLSLIYSGNYSYISSTGFLPPILSTYAVLASSVVTSTGNTVINGDLGLFPGSTISGFPTGVINGVTQQTTTPAQLAQKALVSFYSLVSSLPCDVALTGQDLGGMTLVPGVYCFTSSATLTGTLTFDSQKKPNPIWIFKIVSTLTTQLNSNMVFLNGDASGNVFWNVGSTAALLGASFSGNINAVTSISMSTANKVVKGRLFAQNGAVGLVSNTVTSTAELTSPFLKMFYTVTDSDIDDPKSTQAMVKVTVFTNTPVANEDIILTQFNTNAVIAVSTLLGNDVAPTSQNVVFKSLVSCTQLDPTYYCLNGQQPVLSANGQTITLGYTPNSCAENHFQYCIATDVNPTGVSCTKVTVRYQNCVCQKALDIIYIVDSSGSITQSNWYQQINFLTNVTKQLTFGANAINVGIVQFGTNINIQLNLNQLNTQQNVLDALTYLYSNHMATSTNTIGSLVSANSVASSSLRSTASKVYMLLTDGLANQPCTNSGCGGAICDCDTCLNGGPSYGTNTCQWAPTSGGYFCQPCASPTPLANQINAYKVGSPPGITANYKIVALGIGDILYFYNNKGWNMVKTMNFDPPNTLAAPWTNLPAAMSQLIDSSCNT